MIYVMARDLDDAKQWCRFNGVTLRDGLYVDRPSVLIGRTMTPRDRIVRTARFHEHAFWPEIDMAMAEVLIASRVTETAQGRLVRTGG